MKNDELKPCPFCGEKAKIEATDNGSMFHVECSVCHARTDDYYPKYKGDTVLDWNRRTPANNIISDELRTALTKLLLSIRDVIALIEP